MQKVGVLMIKIAIAEDNKIIARTLKEKLSVFADEGEIKFIAKNGFELLEKLKSEKI